MSLKCIEVDTFAQATNNTTMKIILHDGLENFKLTNL